MLKVQVTSFFSLEWAESSCDPSKDQEYLNVLWDKGRNNCPPNNNLCLKKWIEMPGQFQHFDGDGLFSNMFVREPMDRLG